MFASNKIVIVALALGMMIANCDKGDALKCWLKKTKDGEAKEGHECKKDEVCAMIKANGDWAHSACLSLASCGDFLSEDCSKFSEPEEIKDDKDPYNGEDAEICCCKTDNCNGAPFDHPLPWLLSLFVAVVIAANHQHK